MNDGPTDPVVSDKPEGNESLDVLYEYTQRHGDLRNAQIVTLDGKANFVLGAASLLTAGVTTFLSFSSTARAGLKGDIGIYLSWATPMLSVLALLCYLFIVWAALQGYRVRSFKEINEIRNLRNKYLTGQPQTTKLVILDTMIDTIEKNAPEIKSKATWTACAVWSLLVEATALTALLLVQVLLQVVH